MNLFRKHIIQVGSVVLLLFFISNSGFTMLLTTCKMENSSCCVNMKSENSCNATPSTTQAIKKVSSNCMETKLVGNSSSTKQAVVEFQIHIPSLKEITSLILSANSFILSQFNALVALSTKFLSNAIASVEKYVLTSILRI